MKPSKFVHWGLEAEARAGYECQVVRTYERYSSIFLLEDICKIVVMTLRREQYILSVLGPRLEMWSRGLPSTFCEREKAYLHSHVHRYAEVLEEFGKRTGIERVLDIGALYGHIAIVLKGLGYDLQAIDIANPKTKYLEERFRMESIDFRTHDVCDGFPYSDDWFDAVLFCDVLEHLSEPISCLREIRRVLRRGGYLFLTTPNLSSLYNRIRLLFGKSCLAPTKPAPEGWLRSDVGFGHLHEYTSAEIFSILSACRFSKIQIRLVNSMAKTTSRYPRLAKFLYLSVSMVYPSFRDTILCTAEKPTESLTQDK